MIFIHYLPLPHDFVSQENSRHTSPPSDKVCPIYAVYCDQIYIAYARRLLPGRLWLSSDLPSPKNLAAEINRGSESNLSYDIHRDSTVVLVLEQ